jgi:DNA helicase HerA-like ATPase
MDEAQEFVPSTGSAQSTRSTVELIRQIRKYGLGMILASQRPKGVDNEAVNNTATQFIGRLTSPVQIEAAGQMAAARGSVLDNLGGLERGTFFAATEGTGYTSIRVPHCLSHHAEPLDEGEVVARARRSG